MRRFHFALLLVPTLAACVHGSSGPISLPLRWTATGEDMRILRAGKVEVLRRHEVSVMPFTDARGGHDDVGVNLEHGGHIEVTTPDDVVRFLSEQFAEVLRANGIKLAARSDADRLIRAEVQRFFVTESNVYEGSVILGVSVTDPAGRVLWSGVTEGRSKRWGRSMSPENYQEALTSASLEAMKDLAGQPDFFEAFR